MRTADEMYQYCLENNCCNGLSKKNALKHFTLIERELKSDEEVLISFIGIQNFVTLTKSDGCVVYAVTNERLIIAKRDFLNEVVETIYINDIHFITYKGQGVTGTIVFNTIKSTFTVLLGTSKAREIVETLHQIKDKNIIKNKDLDTSNIVSNVSITDELLKLNELLEKGSLTREEFDRMKSKLLSNIY